MRIQSAMVITAVTLSACASGTGGRCAAIVDDVVDVFQALVSEVDELDLSEVAAAGDDFSIPGIDEVERRAEELQREAEAAGCEDDELRDLLAERLDSLEARTVFGQAVIEGIRREGLPTGR